MALDKNSFDLRIPPFETEDLRNNLAAFLDSPFDSLIGESLPVGNYKWGVYAFFDYDGEPIYVGQTYEKLRTRIRRHLTNQRTDAVAMSVLDPFEVLEVEVWPLPQFEATPASDKSALHYLNALERTIVQDATRSSRFKAILNEKDPPPSEELAEVPPSKRGRIVSDRVFDIRAHPDTRIARRSLIISRLAQVVAERKVQGGLRRVLLTQARRLEWLSQQRFEGLGGSSSVPPEGEDQGPDGEEQSDD